MSRGYTGHEHLTVFGLINMNARLYDPALGRFLSPDPYVQSPDNSQNYNRYSYCLNNPLRYSDPSGELFGIDDGILIAGFLIYTAIAYLASVRDTGYKDWTPHVNAIGAGYSGTNGGYVGFSFDGDNHFSNVGLNNGLTAGSTNYGFTYMSHFDLSVDPVQYLMQKEQEIRYDDAANRNYQKNTNAWIENVNYTSGALSTAGYIIQKTQNGTFRLTNGTYNGSELSFKYYSNGWEGGSVADITTYSVSKMGGYLSLGASVVGTASSYAQLYKGTGGIMTMPDATIGTIGLANSLAPYMGGSAIPVVGEGVAIYGIGRFTWDTFFDLGQKYGPSTWYGTDDTKWFK